MIEQNVDDYKVHGRNYYPTNIMPVGINRNEDFVICNTLADRFKIINILKGNGVVSINSVKMPLFSNSIIVLNEKDKIVLECADNVAAQSIYFNPKMVNSDFTLDKLYQIDRKNLDATTVNDHTNIQTFLTDDVQKKIFLLPDITRLRVFEIFDRIDNEATDQDNEFWPCSIRQHTIQLLFLIVKLKVKNTVPVVEIPLSTKELENVVLFLHTFYHTKISLNSLSREFNTNRTTLSEKFKVEFQMTIMTYLAKLRINIAASLLKNTKLTVDEVAGRIGFVDLPHFSRNFKKYMNSTPSDFRNSVCQVIPVNQK